MTSVLNFIKISWLVQKLMKGTDRQTDTKTHRQEGDLISLHYSFRKEGRLKIHAYTSVLKLPLLIDLQQKVRELVLSITSCPTIISLEHALN
jgi:hypothetical protein